jgi:hypothetical protein
MSLYLGWTAPWVFAQRSGLRRWAIHYDPHNVGFFGFQLIWSNAFRSRFSVEFFLYL